MLRRIVYSLGTPKLYLFPGQGTQEKGMFESVKQKYADLIKTASKAAGLDLIQISQTDGGQVINKPHVAQPLVVIGSYIQSKVQQIQVTEEDYLIGHSVGEYSALLLSGGITLEACMKLVRVRGQLIEKYTKQESGMLVVVAKTQDLDKVHRLIQQNGLEIGCYNTKTQLVVSGTRSLTRQLYTRLKASRVICTFLPVEAAFHCLSLQPMADEFRKILQDVQWGPLKGKVIRNFDCEFYRSKQDVVQGLVRQLYNPVRFYQSVTRIPGEIQYVELSHKPIVTRFIKQIRRS